MVFYMKSLNERLSLLNVGTFYFVFADMWWRCLYNNMLFIIDTMEIKYELVSSLK